MRFRFIYALSLFLALTLAACSDDEPPKTVEEVDVKSPTFGIINLLQASGNEVEVMGGAPHAYFDTKNVLIRVGGGADLELYEFDSKEELEEEAAKIAPDGSKIDGETINWKSPPHFFKTEKVIILYNGADASNVAQLASAFGAQFAGK